MVCVPQLHLFKVDLDVVRHQVRLARAERGEKTSCRCPRRSHAGAWMSSISERVSGMLLEGEAAPGEELAAPSVHTWIHPGFLLSRSRSGFFFHS